MAARNRAQPQQKEKQMSWRERNKENKAKREAADAKKPDLSKTGTTEKWESDPWLASAGDSGFGGFDMDI